MNNYNELNSSEHNVRTMVGLPLEVDAKFQRMIDAQLSERLANPDLDEKSIKIGSPCRNYACKAVYTGSDEDKTGKCVHHPGTAVFHEGMKYWSCCKKKTTDFTTFLDQLGCATGQHNWSKVIEEKVREDWFQSCGQVHITIFCKGTLPDKSSFQTDGLILRVILVHGFGDKQSSLDYELYGEIVPEASRVVINERKVELILKQRMPDVWPKLRPLTEQEKLDEERVIAWNGLNQPAERPNVDDPSSRAMVGLPLEVDAKFRHTIDAQLNERLGNSGLEEESVKIGSPCRNFACIAIFTGSDEDRTGKCVHHPGTAVFHEGMKYWSCCKRKTSDFHTFTDQLGCTTGQHNWDRVIEEKVREDWFQSCGQVHLTIFCKGTLPDRSSFQTDGLILRVILAHGFGDKQSSLDYELYGEIVPDASKVIINERKVELILKQRMPNAWPKLRLK